MRAALAFMAFLFCMPLFGLAADFPEAGKVSILNISEDHCIPCKMMNKMLARLQAEYQGKIAAVTVDALKERASAAQYKVQTLPTLIFFSPDGQEVYRHTGIMEEGVLRARIDTLLAE